jgi:hypothetical protein
MSFFNWITYLYCNIRLILAVFYFFSLIYKLIEYRSYFIMLESDWFALESRISL